MTALILGGAGFIGANVARRHLERGESVILFDNLSRSGAHENLIWLEELGGARLRVVLGDAAREPKKLAAEVARATRIYHLAGQVAVTSSLEDPMADHEANLVSTLNLLEAMRACGSEAPLLFSSTNKVYGALGGVEEVLEDGRWRYADGRTGVDERQPLDFHSPYGCSKGAADQYVRDYGRVFGLRTIVFRQSCIYGPRQFGIEAQGWIVHFILAFALRRSVAIYGDGCQVRDALYVDDLIDAFDLAAARGEELQGAVFNVGGGAANSLSILELHARLTTLFGYEIEVRHGHWRQGDQKVFVADNGLLAERLGWSPQVALDDGLARTVEFVRSHLELFSRALHRHVTGARAETV